MLAVLREPGDMSTEFYQICVHLHMQRANTSELYTMTTNWKQQQPMIVIQTRPPRSIANSASSEGASKRQKIQPTATVLVSDACQTSPTNPRIVVQPFQGHHALDTLESESDGSETQIAATWLGANAVKLKVTKPTDGINNTHSTEMRFNMLTPQNFECSDQLQVAPRALDTDLIFEAMFAAC